MEGRRQPLHIRPRRETGKMVAHIFDSTKSSDKIICSIVTGDGSLTLVVKDPKVVVVYE